MTVTFEFPTSAADKDRLIAKHKRKGLQWVSSAYVDGRMRMKFKRAKHLEKPKVIPYAGYANNGGRGEWER
ncbi:hypothetical protein SJ05684_c10440 [Sinorhizobium sojae CCBAU 05684]|uniref:Uncharacterized protein n=1 Tax=Sinorhizobium sojae CCBAU 05684 TaxID=716928 RepID=A0A249P9S7_9HYPH|nr:hypothetical protein [Sinorhizobium sojae]ASY62502.1 hypothetical protein SJ05684_c10440 [Sinorhizobium sojae CCBAU 05684]